MLLEAPALQNHLKADAHGQLHRPTRLALLRSRAATGRNRVQHMVFQNYGQTQEYLLVPGAGTAFSGVLLLAEYKSA